MKAKWALLTKVQLLELLGVNKARHSSDGRAKRRFFGAAAVLGIVGLILVAFTASVCVLLAEQGMGGHVPAFMLAIASFTVFLYALVRGAGGLFAVRDYDLIMSMPVKKRDMIASRLLVAYLTNLAFTLVFMLPAMVVYFVYCGFTFGTLGAIVFATICAPLAPLAVALTVGTLLSALTAGFKYRNVLRAVFGILVFGALMAVYMLFTLSANADIGADLSNIASVLIGKAYPPALLLDLTLTGGAVWGVFAFAGGSLALAAIFCLIVSACYTRIHFSLQARSAKKAYKAEQIRRSSAFSALVKKEFKRLFGSSTYMLNSVGGLIVLIILVIVMLAGFGDSVFTEAQFLPNVPYSLAGLCAAMLGTACPAASALSLEGSARGQLFAMPVSARKILLAKAMPTFVLDGAASAAVAVVCCAISGAAWPAYILCPLSGVAAAALVALGGIFLNYKYPKYEWTQEIQVVKRGAPVMILSFGMLIPGILVTVLSLLFGWIPLAALAILCAVLAVLVFVRLKKVQLFV